MRNIKKLSFITVVMLLLCSCTESKMKNFAEKFVTAVASNDTTAIAQMYPNANIADKLSLNFTKDSVTVEEVADTFVVYLGNGKSLSILKDEEGELYIADSHGVFSYPEERMDFALKTGWIDKDMSDLKIAEQFKDTMFINYLAQKNAGQIKTKLVVKSINYKSSDSDFYSGLMTWVTTIANESEFEIPGSFYEVFTDYLRWHKKYDGKDIKPGERHTFTLTVETNEGEPSSRIRFKVSDADLLAKFFTPKGGEYEAYKRSHISK